MIKNTKNLSNEQKNILPPSKFVRAILPLTIASAVVFLVANTINIFSPTNILAPAIALCAAIVAFATVVAMAVEKIIKMKSDGKKKNIPVAREEILTMQKDSSDVKTLSKSMTDKNTVHVTKSQKFKAKFNNIINKKQDNKKAKIEMPSEEDDSEKNL